MSDVKDDINREDLDLVDDSLEDEGKDADALWSEFDQADQSAATDGSDGTPPPDDDTGRGDEGGGGDWNAADEGAEGDGTPDSAADDGQSDDVPSSDQASGNAQDQDENLWANATPEQRAAFEAAQQERDRLDHQLRSNRGRMSAMQRQINDLTRQQPQQQAASNEAAGGQQSSGGEGQGGEEGADGFLTSDEWKSFKDEYPEVAGPMEKVIGNLQTHITRQDRELSAIGDERRQSALEEQADILSEAHPDWQEVTADETFVGWLEGQPRHVREAAHRNGQGIVDADEAADVVGRFKAYRSAQNPGGDSPQKSSEAPRTSNGAGDGNNKLTGRRQRQLESASTTRTRGPGAATGISEDGDPEQIWKQFDQMERRQARG